MDFGVTGDKMKKLYMVLHEFEWDNLAKNYCLGIFENLEDAKNLINKQKEKIFSQEYDLREHVKCEFIKNSSLENLLSTLEEERKLQIFDKKEWLYYDYRIEEIDLNVEDKKLISEFYR